MDLKCKKKIVEWIMANSGFVYSQFTFLPEEKGEILPTEEEFESLLYRLDDWELSERSDLDQNEQEMYPGATKRFKYIFKPLNGALLAHVFADENDVLYVVVST